jgi:hypothetical protein
MQIDDNSANNVNGSVLLLLDLGAGNTASNVLTAGQYVSGNNTVLAAAGFEDYGGTNTAFTSLVFNMGSANAGDELALRWFPQITLAQYEANTPTVAGEVFGTFNPGGAATDGGSAWVLQSNGSTFNLTFNTQSAGGNELNTAGFAGTAVLPAIGVVPEPSTYVLLGVGVVVLLAIRRRVASV